jgi:hypothetical protein
MIGSYQAHHIYICIFPPPPGLQPGGGGKIGYGRSLGSVAVNHRSTGINPVVAFYRLLATLNYLSNLIIRS